MADGDVSLRFKLFGSDETASHAFDKVGRSSEHLHTRVLAVGKSLGALAIGGIAGGAALGIAGLGAAMFQGVKDAESYQTLQLKTQAVLKSTGNVAGTSVKQIDDLAGSLESLSGVDEELIINSQNVLATFTGVRNEAGKGNDIFTQGTKAALDLSVALGTDLQGSTIQIGKALNDPIKGVTALQRVGVSFTASQKDQIKAMVAAGDTMGAQKLILGELNKEFGGAAKAAGSGFSGSMARVQDAVSDAFRSIGQMLLPTLTDLGNWLADKGIPAIIDFATTIGPKLKPAVESAKVFLKAAGDYLTGSLIPAVMGIATSIGTNLGPVLLHIGQTAAPLVVGALKLLGGIVTAVGGWIANELIPVIARTAESILPNIRQAIATVTAAFRDHQGIVNVVVAVFKILGSFVTTILIPLIGELAKVILAILGPAFRLIGTLVDTIVVPGLKFMMNTFLNVAGAIVDGAAWAFGWIPGIGPKLKSAQTAFHKFRDDVNAALNGITKQTVAAVDVAVRVNGTPVNIRGGGNLGEVFNISAGGHNVGARASGGPVAAGAAYLVGERGPEIVTFGSSGHVSTNADSRRMLAGGASGGDTHVHIHMPTGFVGSTRELAVAMSDVLQRAKSQGIPLNV